MAVDRRAKEALVTALSSLEETPVTGPRLVGEAHRLWGRVQRLIAMGLVSEGLQLDALELACSAIHLPLRSAKLLPRGKFGKTNLRDRSEQSAELLVGVVGETIDESLLDRATRILHELPHRSPVLDEAKLLADALNLDDFGVAGLFVQAIDIGRHGDGVAELADAAAKREQYGYWDARLKDGFHFEPVRQMARRRLEQARAVVNALSGEIGQDTPGG